MANYTLNYTGEKVDELLYKIDTAFGEETVMGDTLTWDGDMTGKPVVTLDMGDGAVMNFCKVSEAIPTAEDIANGVTGTVPGQGTQEVPADTITTGDGYMFAEFAAIISTPNTTVAEVGLTFPETGTWLVSQTQAGATIYISEIKINGYIGFETTEITTIDEKYLPKTDPDLIFMLDNVNNINVSNWTATCNKTLAEMMGLLDKFENGKLKVVAECNASLGSNYLDVKASSIMDALVKDSSDNIIGILHLFTITFITHTKTVIVQVKADGIVVAEQTVQ